MQSVGKPNFVQSIASSCVLVALWQCIEAVEIRITILLFEIVGSLELLHQRENTNGNDSIDVSLGGLKYWLLLLNIHILWL